MDNLRYALNDVMKKRMSFLKDTMNVNLDVQEFMESLENLYDIILSNPNMDFRIFVQQHARSLQQLESSLMCSDQYSETLNKDLEQMHHKIFTQINYKEHIVSLEKKATEIFNEFVKGITYFDCEVEASPQRYEIEQLIFDKIYENTLKSQHPRHTDRQLSVRINSINFSNTGIPVYVCIGFFNQDHIVAEESFIKDIGDECVYCMKKDYENDKCYEKMQTFTNPKEWMEVLEPIQI